MATLPKCLQRNTIWFISINFHEPNLSILNGTRPDLDMPFENSRISPL
jgi:hypothetical protein